MLRRGLLVLAAAGMLLAPAAAPVASPRESIGIRVLGKGPYLVLRLEPGSTGVHQVAVSSTLSRAVDISVLALNAETISGEFRIFEQTPEWLTVYPSVVHFDAVPPGQVIEKAATVTIAIRAAARPATREAAVLAVAPPSRSGSVRMVNRVGVRVYLTIVGPTFPWPALGVVLGVGVALGGGLWGLSRYRRPHRRPRRNLRSPVPRARLGT